MNYVARVWGRALGFMAIMAAAIAFLSNTLVGFGLAAYAAVLTSTMAGLVLGGPILARLMFVRGGVTVNDTPYTPDLKADRAYITFGGEKVVAERCDVASFDVRVGPEPYNFYVTVLLKPRGLGETGAHLFTTLGDYTDFLTVTTICRSVVIEADLKHADIPLAPVDCLLDPSGRCIGIASPALNVAFARSV